MRRLPAAALLLALAGAAPAQAQEPPCDPARNGAVVATDVIDPRLRPGADTLYATHRLQFRLDFAEGRVEDPDGTRYDPDANTLRLAPGPGTVGRFDWIGETAGAHAVPANWTVMRSAMFEPVTPFCAGSGTVPVTLAEPQPTRFSARTLTNQLSARDARLKVQVALGAAEDLSPVDVAIRPGRTGPRIPLGAVYLADAGTGVRDPARPTTFSRKVSGMTITAGPRDALVDTRGVATLAVRMPKARAGRATRRDFTLFVAREGTTLFSVRTGFRCRGLGSRAVQVCERTGFRVRR